VFEDAHFRDVLDPLPAAREGHAVPLPGLLTRAPGLARLAELSGLAASGSPGAVPGATVSASVVDDLRSEFDGALAGEATTRRRLRGGGRAVRVTAAAVEYLEAARGRAVYSEEIASAIGVTPRFVNHCFDAVYGISVHRYLRLRRFAEVRRRLMAGVDGLLVKQVALDVGMFHFGRFARDYHALYGESPSQTLATGAARRR